MIFWFRVAHPKHSWSRPFLVWTSMITWDHVTRLTFPIRNGTVTSNLSWFMSFLANICAKFLGLALLSLYSRFPIEYSFDWALPSSYRSVGGRSWFAELIKESFRAFNVNFRCLWSSRGSIDVISASFNSRSIGDVVKAPIMALDCLLISF
jgi:hypothetical protein